MLLRGGRPGGITTTGTTRVFGDDVRVSAIGDSVSIADIDGDGDSDGDLVAGGPRSGSRAAGDVRLLGEATSILNLDDTGPLDMLAGTSYDRDGDLLAELDLRYIEKRGAIVGHSPACSR